MGKYKAIVQEHLVLPARVGLPVEHAQFMHLRGMVAPPSVTVRLVIDTGSKRSTIIPGVIAHLMPMRAGEVRVESSLAIGDAALFWVNLDFPGTSLRPIEMMSVARLPMPPSLATFHGLIGRDLLHRWESFCYQGRRRMLSISDRPGGLLGWLRR